MAMARTAAVCSPQPRVVLLLVAVLACGSGCLTSALHEKILDRPHRYQPLPGARAFCNQAGDLLLLFEATPLDQPAPRPYHLAATFDDLQRFVAYQTEESGHYVSAVPPKAFSVRRSWPDAATYAPPAWQPLPVHTWDHIRKQWDEPAAPGPWQAIDFLRVGREADSPAPDVGPMLLLSRSRAFDCVYLTAQPVWAGGKVVRLADDDALLPPARHYLAVFYPFAVAGDTAIVLAVIYLLLLAEGGSSGAN